MANENLKIEGFKEIDQILGALGKSLGKKVVRKAIRDGAAPLLKQARMNASHADVTGNLKRSLGFVTGIDETGYKEVVGARRGRGNTADGWYAHIIEYGAAPHIIKPKGKNKKKLLKLSGGGFAKQVQHPGIKAQPFLRPAWDAKNKIVVQQVGENLRKILASNFKGVFK